MTGPRRQFHLPMAELIDRLTVDQIKEVLLECDKEDLGKEVRALEHDIDLLIDRHGLTLSGRLIRIVIILSQMNLHIWYNKDQMGDDPKAEGYLPRLQLSHQLNGIRNQMKNLLLAETGEKNGATTRANFNTDNLTGWDIRI